MTKDVQAGWLHNKEDGLFAPKTLMDLVQDVDGTKLKEYIETHGESGGGVNNYSTEEHKIGTWIDGSDIYEKTYCPIQSSILEEDFSNKELIDSHGYIKYTTGNILTIGCAYNTLYKNSSNQLVIEGVNGIFDFTYPYNNITIRYIYNN